MRTETDKRQVEYVAVSALTPYALNSRKHSPKQVKQIAASIREFGFTNPVLIDANDVIIAGHGRVLAAEHLQLDQVPCIRLENLTETQIKAYVLADNKLAENATWDEEMLLLEIEALKAVDFDIDIIGFDVPQLDAVTNSDSPQPSVLEAPERLKNPDEAFDDYENSTIRQIILILDTEEYDSVIHSLDLIKDKHGFTNNTEAALYAINALINSGGYENSISEKEAG
jgi:hypothetical protein